MSRIDLSAPVRGRSRWPGHSVKPAAARAGQAPKVAAACRPRTLWQADPMAGPAHRRDEPSRRSPFSRSANLERLAAGPFDVLVIGGGVTGAGVALDAASRGLTTALVEKADFASGTSSKSSKLIHGGIRYLQQREFRLVYENLAERQRLLENAAAPRLAAPLLDPVVRPIRGGLQGGRPLVLDARCGCTT